MNNDVNDNEVTSRLITSAMPHCKAIKMAKEHKAWDLKKTIAGWRVDPQVFRFRFFFFFF